RDVSPWIHDLPENGVINELPDWRWLATPGHSPGHISLFRESDRVLLAGDAMATANMDSYIGAITNAQTLWRAGTPLTCDWRKARESVSKLAGLDPEVIACGHGVPMRDRDLPARFRHFAENFKPPARGRYVGEPAITDENGVVWLPPAPFDPVPLVAAGLIAGGALGYFASRRRD
ncbi:MAG: MBL fold metallo-hydrolase, partial [Verrucomicrobiota bacterium]|nr:MBL fold metallo-hydrolase [Verrucomicrobiota bacterium]